MLIAATGISHTYDAGTPNAHQVLTDIDVQLSEQRIGVIGHNGSGKSTFVRMLDGLVKPTAGRIVVDGIDVGAEPAKVRRQTGFLFTDPDAQIIMPTVREDVAFSLRREKLPKAETNARVDAMLDRLGLTPFAEQPAHLLSGGQKQLLALAAVLITNPRLIIMDEPTTLLDIRNARLIGQVIATLEQMVILATHHLYLLEGFDRVIVFDQGRLVADGAPSEVIPFYRELMDRPVEVSDL